MQGSTDSYMIFDLCSRYIEISDGKNIVNNNQIPEIMLIVFVYISTPLETDEFVEIYLKYQKTFLRPK